MTLSHCIVGVQTMSNQEKVSRANEPHTSPSPIQSQPELAVQQQPAPMQAYQRVRSPMHVSSPDDVRVLQRTVGNQSVQKLFGVTTQRRSNPPAQETAQPVQRKENTTGLPDALKAGIEARSALSLDDVHVHYHSSRPAQVQALAYTQGTDIYVGPGQEQHLAHEAWHVVQQKQGRVQATLQSRGVAINDDVALEREADVKGKLAVDMRTGPKMPGTSQKGTRDEIETPVVQRVLHVTNAQNNPIGPLSDNQKKRLRQRHNANAKAIRKIGDWINDNNQHQYTTWREVVEAAQGVLALEGSALYPLSYPQARGGGLSLSEFPTRQGHQLDRGLYDWLQQGRNLEDVTAIAQSSMVSGNGTISIDRHSPIFNLLLNYVLDNHRRKPYVTDYFHESKPTMKALMANENTLLKMYHVVAGILGDLRHVVASYGIHERPRIVQIISIEVVVNKRISDAYNEAKRQLHHANMPPNERYLFSGYRRNVQDILIRGGHRPDIGPYVAGSYGKGHGALGRGAYLTDRIDKAISYAEEEAQGGREYTGSVVLNKVILGNIYRVERGQELRHEHHSNLERPSLLNAGMNRVNTGTSNTSDVLRVEQYGSIMGRQTYESGGSLITAARSAAIFDSNEFLVRNADQIFPQFIIHYRIRK